MLVVVVNVKVKPEALVEFERAVLEDAALSVEREPGCVRFEVSQGVADPTEWLLYEVYADADSLESHRQQPHFLAYQAVAERVLVSRMATRYLRRG